MNSDEESLSRRNTTWARSYLGQNRSDSDQSPSNTPGSGASSDTQDPPESDDIVRMRNMEAINNFFGGQSNSDECSDSSESESEEHVAKRLRLEEEEEQLMLARNNAFLTNFFHYSTESEGEEGETILDGGNEDDVGIPETGWSSSDQQTEDEASSEDEVSIEEESLESGIALPSRRCTHIEDEQATFNNLFSLLPKLHQERIRM
jgi:hypothetical protein